MREIKFRVWNKDKKCFFVSNHTIGINNENKNIWGEVQPYTGLKDCKRTEEYPDGQEIYEGDIVNTSQGIAVLVWDDLMWCLKFNYEETPQMIIPSLLEIEVIGNIHQNKELTQ